MEWSTGTNAGICKSSAHWPDQCSKLLDMSIDNRVTAVKENHVCFCFVVNNKYIAATNGFKLCSLISVNTHMRSKSIVKIQQS